MGQSRSVARAVRAGVFFALAAPAAAQPVVSTTPSSGPTYSVVPVAGGKYRVTLNTTVVAQPTTFLVRGVAADKIENLIVNATTPQIVFVEVRGMTAGTSITSLDLFEVGASTATVVIQDLRTSGDVGVIHTQTISATNIGGDVTGEIRLLPRNGGGESTLISATIAGRARGDIVVDYGAIFGLTAAGGIGSMADPVIVRTQRNIVRITAGEIYADINTFGNAGWGVTGRIQTNTGPFVGSLVTNALQSTGPGEPGVLSIAGDLDADITFVNQVNNDNGGQPVISIGGLLNEGRRINIGTSLVSGAEMRITTGAGLEGAVIINKNNAGGAWNGSVVVGATALNPVPAYSATSASLGGGSVGVVPFALHGSDCFPVRGAVLSGSGAPTAANPIRLRHYGPVMWSGVSPPVIVERRAIGSGGAWVDQTGCFVFGMEPGDSPSDTVLAAFPLQKLARGFTYRIRPVLAGADALLCDIGLAMNPPVANYSPEYTFSILSDCPGDADGNGLVNFTDITTILANFGSAGSGCGIAGDSNADGTVNFTDITSTLAGWGSVCP